MGARLPQRLALAAPALVGTVALLAVARLGPYTSPDSASYIGLARSLAGGNGFEAPPGTPPVGGFPPLFPLVLALFGRAGVDPLDAARWLNPALFGLIAWLVARVVARQTGSTAAGVVAAVVLLGALDLLVYSASALSEPLFTLLAIAALVAVAAHVERPSAATLALAGGLAAGAVLTRYAGVAVSLAGAIALLRARQWRAAAAFAAVALVPAAAWVAWAGGVRRPLVWHGLPGSQVLAGARSASRWVLPDAVHWPVRVVVAAGAAGLLVAAAIRLRQRRRARPLAVSMGLFAAVYLGVLLAYRLLLDATGLFDARMLLPLHVAAVLVVAPLLAGTDSRWVRAGIAALLGAQLVQAAGWVAGGLSDRTVARRGYAAAPWRTSTVVGEIAALDPAVPVYTNGPDAVFLLSGRATASIPSERDQLSGRPAPDYGELRAALGDDMERNGGMLAYFDAITARKRFQPSQAELKAALPLEVVRRDGVGTLYRLTDAGRERSSSATPKARSSDWRALSRGSQAVR